MNKHLFIILIGCFLGLASLKAQNLDNPGDYVTHIDHGIGRFAGLQKLNVNGKEQETVKLLFKDNDALYVSIHSLHRISKFSGKEGQVPRIDKLGSTTWQTLKNKTKRNVKELAYDLIKLYAERKAKDEPLIAWQMNWKGENFYTGNRVHVFVDLDNKALLEWIGKNTGRHVFFVLEHSRLDRLRKLLAPRTLEALTTQRERHACDSTTARVSTPIRLQWINVSAN